MMTTQNKIGLTQHLTRKLLTFLFCISFLTSCSLPSISNTSGNEGYFDNDALATNPVEIQFILEIPQTLSQDESIELEILDDISGIPNNIQRHKLSQESDLIFRTTLSIPVGSVIKYRYVRIGETLTIEAKQDGDSLRYRMFYVRGTGTINDFLQGWHGEPTDLATGWLTGTVFDSETSNPVPDVLVNAGGQLTFADANGNFSLRGLTPGIHNVLFFAIDGKYQSYQQGALIAPNSNTTAQVKLVPMAAVNVTFRVTPPNDALGAPIHIAGNLIQLGNTFTNLPGSMSVKPKRMPTLVNEDDGSFALTLQLYSGSDLRYKFTLGDGYWNAEQDSSGGSQVRQLVVPDHDITVYHVIESWRTLGIEPITFQVSIPPETSPPDEKYIQFKTDDWTEPVPLWQTDGGNYLYILFSPLVADSSISYRFCRNENCESARNLEANDHELSFTPSTTAQTITTTINSWENWQVFDQPNIDQGNNPENSSTYLTAIELTPDMNPAWKIYAPIGISKIADLNANLIIFTPRWVSHTDTPGFHPVIGETPFYYELTQLLQITETFDMKRGLFPQIASHLPDQPKLETSQLTAFWWETWFDSYRQLVLNYAKVAEQTSTEKLILGGKSVLHAFAGGVLPDGSQTPVPETSEIFWLTLIDEIRSVYKGELIWAANAHQEMDPLPEFIDLFDGLYICIDSPLTTANPATFDEIAAGFTSVIDNLIYEAHRSTGLPVTLALAYPSVDGAAQGCQLLGTDCNNDGLFLPNELTSFTVNLEKQRLIYDAILPVAASREWITGISIRGYEPTVNVHDGSSSTAGKPATTIIQEWFLKLTSE